MSSLISLPDRSTFTHNRSSIAKRFRGSSSKELYRIASKLPNRANIAKSKASR